MKRRTRGLIRVLSSCARCGGSCGIFPFRVDYGLVGHELSVCHDCDALPKGEATVLEQSAMGLDPTNPIDVLEFVERFTADPARVRRTAAHFLGQARYNALLPACRESFVSMLGDEYSDDNGSDPF